MTWGHLPGHTQRRSPDWGPGSKAGSEGGEGRGGPSSLRDPSRPGAHLYCLARSMYSCCSMPWESAADTSMMLLWGEEAERT